MPLHLAMTLPMSVTKIRYMSNATSQKCPTKDNVSMYRQVPPLFLQNRFVNAEYEVKGAENLLSIISRYAVVAGLSGYSSKKLTP